MATAWQWPWDGGALSRPILASSSSFFLFQVLAVFSFYFSLCFFFSFFELKFEKIHEI